MRFSAPATIEKNILAARATDNKLSTVIDRDANGEKFPPLLARGEKQVYSSVALYKDLLKKA